MITVFTPTYNRARLLPRLYESLCRQTYRDFEWVVVDDGSTDNTKEVVDGFVSEQKINLRYFRQSNGGKHRAINRGVREARGELFCIVDSDDWIPDDSLKNIAALYQTIKGNKVFAGVSGHRGYSTDRYVGSGQDEEYIDTNSLDIRYKYHITGDLNEVFRTCVLREFPFPELDGERFCSEALVWNRIASKYLLRFSNKITYIADYQPDGLTSNIVRIRMESPIASVTHYQELNSCDIPLKQKVKAAINYWRFKACVPRGKDVPKLPWCWFWCRFLGYLMHLRDKKIIAEV